MQDVIKVLTAAAWAMIDDSGYDILIKATIRAGHMMTNSPHLEPREHHFLTHSINGKAKKKRKKRQRSWQRWRRSWRSEKRERFTWERKTQTDRCRNLGSQTCWDAPPLSPPPSCFRVLSCFHGNQRPLDHRIKLCSWAGQTRPNVASMSFHGFVSTTTGSFLLSV